MLYEFVSMEVINKETYETNQVQYGDWDVFDCIETFEPERQCAFEDRFRDLLPDKYELTSDYYDEPLVTRGSFEYHFLVRPCRFVGMVDVIITNEYDNLGMECCCDISFDADPPYVLPSVSSGCIYLVVEDEPYTVGEAVGLLQRFENDIRDCAWCLISK